MPFKEPKSIFYTIYNDNISGNYDKNDSKWWKKINKLKAAFQLRVFHTCVHARKS